MVRIGLLGATACILGLAVIIVARLALYPAPAGSNFDFTGPIVFLSVLLVGAIIFLGGLAILTYLAVYRRECQKAG